jgi:predicted ATPase
MITKIRLQNYRSFVDAEVALAPFTLVLGANGSGKTNFLRAFDDCGVQIKGEIDNLGNKDTIQPLTPHFNSTQPGGPITFDFEGRQLTASQKWGMVQTTPDRIRIYRLVPSEISKREPIQPFAQVEASGAGTTRVLESLKNGDREDLFDAVEQALRMYVPEVEKLSFATVEQGHKQMQVRERGIGRPIPAQFLSEGTRLIIALLAIIYQQAKPPVICLEDIDHGIHPRVFEQLARLLHHVAKGQGVQIIATTHNPYLVDCFQHQTEAVVIVEKDDGATRLSTLAQKLEGLDYDKITPEDMPLGNLWFSGLVGGVPEFLRKSRG